MIHQTIAVSDLQRKAKFVMRDLTKKARPRIILSHNTPQAVLVDVKTFEKMEEEIAWRRAEDRLYKEMVAAKKEIAAGKGVRGNLEAILATM